MDGARCLLVSVSVPIPVTIPIVIPVAVVVVPTASSLRVRNLRQHRHRRERAGQPCGTLQLIVQYTADQDCISGRQNQSDQRTDQNLASEIGRHKHSRGSLIDLLDRGTLHLFLQLAGQFVVYYIRQLHRLIRVAARDSHVVNLRVRHSAADQHIRQLGEGDILAGSRLVLLNDAAVALVEKIARQKYLVIGRDKRLRRHDIRRGNDRHVAGGRVVGDIQLYGSTVLRRIVIAGIAKHDQTADQCSQQNDPPPFGKRRHSHFQVNDILPLPGEAGLPARLRACRPVPISAIVRAGPVAVFGAVTPPGALPALIKRPPNDPLQFIRRENIPDVFVLARRRLVVSVVFHSSLSCVFLFSDSTSAAFPRQDRTSTFYSDIFYHEIILLSIRIQRIQRKNDLRTAPIARTAVNLGNYEKAGNRPMPVSCQGAPPRRAAFNSSQRHGQRIMEYPKQGAANAAPCGYCVLRLSDNPLLYHWFNRYYAARPASLPACAASEIAHKSSRFPFLFDYLIIAFPFPTASAISSSTRARTASSSAAEAAQVEKVMGLPKTCSISETTRSFP